MADVGLAIERAKDKTEQMQARANAIDELTASGALEDYTGGGDHFRASVTAPAFAGLSRIAQHRLVYDIFGAEIGGPIHALSIKTETPVRSQ